GADGQRRPEAAAAGRRAGAAGTGGAVMKADECAPTEDQYAALFAACEEGLAGGDPARPPSPAEPPGLRQRLDRDLACARLLRQVLHRPATFPTPSPCPETLLEPTLSGLPAADPG